MMSLLDPMSTPPIPTIAMSAVCARSRTSATAGSASRESRAVLDRSTPGACRYRYVAPSRPASSRTNSSPDVSDATVDRPPTSGTTSTLRGWSTEKESTIACSVVPHDNPSTSPSRNDSSSHCAARSPAAAVHVRTGAERRDPHVRQSVPLPERLAPAPSARTVWSCTRISTMPCARAADSIRETFDRLVPSARATSSCD